MRQVQEVIYVAQERRDAFLKFYLQPSDELKMVMWVCGVRRQVFYELENLILETFEYVGNDFYEDMAKLSHYLREQGYLVEKRRRDVPADMLTFVDWWAPLKKLGSVSAEHTREAEEFAKKTDSELYHEMVSGIMEETEARQTYGYSEDDWSESVHF